MASMYIASRRNIEQSKILKRALCFRSSVKGLEQNRNLIKLIDILVSFLRGNYLYMEELE